jgi:hypothetical protein
LRYDKFVKIFARATGFNLTRFGEKIGFAHYYVGRAEKFLKMTRKIDSAK